MFKQSVLSAKNNITSQVIVWPFQERAHVAMDGFRRHRGLPGMLGPVNGSHIPIKAPEEWLENYVNRKNILLTRFGFLRVVFLLVGSSSRE